MQQQSLVNSGKRAYDVLNVVCTDGGTKRSFYFDITGYFGKI
jgi:hypothetical protein